MRLRHPEADLPSAAEDYSLSSVWQIDDLAALRRGEEVNTLTMATTEHSGVRVPSLQTCLVSVISIRQLRSTVDA